MISRMAHRLVWLSLLVSMLAIGCGDESSNVDAGAMDAGIDATVGVDAARSDDAATGEDAATDDAGAVDGGATEDAAPTDPDAGTDASSPRDAAMGSDAGCPAPVCPTPPPGCTWFGATTCSCGTLECPPPTGPCEGPGTTPCRGTELCLYPSGTCGGIGMCRMVPGPCPDVFMPVCGCDGVTYSNDCEAYSNEVSVAFDGECPDPPDCRTVGCPIGESCQGCLGFMGINYVCLPDGSIC